MNALEITDLGRVHRCEGGMGLKAPRDARPDTTEAEVHGPPGPNGAGGTAPRKIVSTVLLPTSGTVRVLGHDVVTDTAEVKRSPGIVFGGDKGAYDRLTGRHDPAFRPADYGLGGAESRRRVDEPLEAGGTGRSLGQHNPGPNREERMTTPDTSTELGFGLHHVQIALPPGGEEDCRAFYVGVLGFVEVPKPPVLAARGGLWVRADALEIHLGVEKGFTPQRKAHPGILVREIDTLAERITAAGHEVTWDDAFPGYRRFYVFDNNGNRLEFLSPRE